MNDYNSIYFQCVFCLSPQLQVSSSSWQCEACGQKYPVISGVPILVRSWVAHEQELEKARQNKPTWYLEEQESEVKNPYRHHLKKRRNYVEGALQQYMDERGSPQLGALLDLGCGDGNHISYLRKYGQEIFGSDYNLVRLARASTRFPQATLFLADILDYPCQNNRFDVVFVNHVVEHILADDKALQTIFRILKPGGLLILGTPNEGAGWWQLAYRLQPKTLQTTDHVHFYTLDSLVKLMMDQGFLIQETRYMGWGVPHWGLDARLRRFRLLDDGFEILGRAFIPRQASSFYVLAVKP